MTFTNGDAYLAIHREMEEYADAIADYAQSYINGEINEEDMLAKVTTYKKLFESTYDLYKQFSAMCERVENLL